MHRLKITDSESTSIVTQLQAFLNGKLIKNGHEELLQFENGFGRGTVRTMDFDSGIRHINFDLKFNTEVEVMFENPQRTPIEFLYISSGHLNYRNSKSELIALERFQNIILASTKRTYHFPAKTVVKLNLIAVDSVMFLQKYDSYLSPLNEPLLSLFKGDKSLMPFQHFGSHNLKLAASIKALNEIEGNSFSRTLAYEAQLTLILAQQLKEYEHFLSSINFNYVLSVKELEQIYELTHFISENISSYSLTIRDLVEASGLSPKKLQKGFRLMYSKSINEYIRHLKMELARDLIKNSDDTISEIVYQIGYRSRSYFSKLFFEYYQILPTEYRDLTNSKELKN